MTTKSYWAENFKKYIISNSHITNITFIIQKFIVWDEKIQAQSFSEHHVANYDAIYRFTLFLEEGFKLNF